jgi:CheY-like chemotaxis protein
MSIQLLIVDDNTLIRETYQSVLSVSGYDVGVAEDLLTTERILKRSTPDYLLLDLMMKPNSGGEILEKDKAEYGMAHEIHNLFFPGKLCMSKRFKVWGARLSGMLENPADS